eukprot:TRINITY_DN65624_c0_g1_i1.p1 TRINITY_DN65624_c0_g1~~TRINITY_DN65624_c0_g1_i1.p1  ORF type:complete len:876 (+),score=182.46 TRINITY_DN65624_c0_g1_i1:119-2746(+)
MDLGESQELKPHATHVLFNNGDGKAPSRSYRELLDLLAAEHSRQEVLLRQLADENTSLRERLLTTPAKIPDVIRESETQSTYSSHDETRVFPEAVGDGQARAAGDAARKSFSEAGDESTAAESAANGERRPVLSPLRSAAVGDAPSPQPRMQLRRMGSHSLRDNHFPPAPAVPGTVPDPSEPPDKKAESEVLFKSWTDSLQQMFEHTTPNRQAFDGATDDDIYEKIAKEGGKKLEQQPSGAMPPDIRSPTIISKQPSFSKELTEPASPAAASAAAVADLHRPARTSMMSVREGPLVRSGRSWWASPCANCLVNPLQNKWVQRWDIVSISALCFVGVVTPFEVGLVAPTEQINALFVVNLLIDFIFTLDLGLQFFLMYPVKTRGGTMMEYRHHRIIRRYLFGWFTVDFLSVFPFGLLGQMMESSALAKLKAVKIIRLLRLLKLMRMSRASRIFHRLECSIPFTYERMNLYKFFIILMLISHWLACVWATTLVAVGEEEGTPRWIDDFTAAEDGQGFRTKDSIWRLYIVCLYFASYTITSVGYGDMGPKNVLERVVCTIMIFCAGISWAYVLGQVCSIVSSMGHMEQEFRKTMDDLNFLMEDRGLPFSMRRRLRSFLLATRHTQRASRQHVVLSRLSPALQGEIAVATNKVWMSKVPFMKGFMKDLDCRDPDAQQSAPGFILEIAMALRHAIFAQQEVFGRPNVLYIMQKGLAAQRLRILRSGSVFGNDFLLENPKLLYSVKCFAMTYSELVYMERDTFLGIIHRYRKAYPKLMETVRKYTVRLALQRGIMAEARRRQLVEHKLKASACVGNWLNTTVNELGQATIDPQPRAAPPDILSMGRDVECIRFTVSQVRTDTLALKRLLLDAQQHSFPLQT